MTGSIKKLANLVLVVCTFGMSVIASKIIHSGRQMCPDCNHPMSRHEFVNGRLMD